MQTTLSVHCKLSVCSSTGKENISSSRNRYKLSNVAVEHWSCRNIL